MISGNKQGYLAHTDYPKTGKSDFGIIQDWDYFPPVSFDVKSGIDWG